MDTRVTLGAAAAFFPDPSFQTLSVCSCPTTFFT
jgi:hypothetical protein